MAQLRKLLLLIVFQYLASELIAAEETTAKSDVKIEELAHFVLKTFIDKPGQSIYSYNSVRVIDAHKQNNSDADYYLKLEFSVSCHPDFVSDAECFPKSLICAVVVTEDPTSGSRVIQDNDTNCELPTHEEEFQKKGASGTLETKDENLKEVAASFPPFILKHNIEHMVAAAEEATTTTDVEERMIVPEEAVVEAAVSEEPEPREVEEEIIIKKQSSCAGCVTDISTDLPELQEFTDEALTMIDESTNGIYKHNLVKISKAQKQAVNGIKYILTLEVAETYCLKTSGQDRETCEPSLTPSKTCVVEFIVKPWRFSRNIISNNCTRDNNELENELEPNFESEIEPNVESKIEPNLESEVKPYFASKSESDRQGIFDYLDEMDTPERDAVGSLEEKYPSEAFEQPEVVDFSEIEPEEHFVNDDNKPFTEGEPVPQEPLVVDEIIPKESTEAYKDTEPAVITVQADSSKLDHHSDEAPEDVGTKAVDDVIASAEEAKVVQANKGRNEDSSEESAEKERESESNKGFAAVDVSDQDKVETDKSSSSSEEVEETHPEARVDDFVGGVFRRKREVAKGTRPGGLKNIDVKEKKLINDLAELSVRTLDEIDADDSKRVVLDVLDAKKQLVDGVMYHLKLRVGSTSCEENKPTTNKCLQDQIATPKICYVQLHRAFAADTTNDVKVVKSECVNEPRSRHRRSGRKLLVGGYEAANVSDPYIQEVASFSLSELDKTSNSLFRQSVVRIVKAEQQVVAGLNIHLTLELGDSNCLKGENHMEPCLCQQENGCPVTQVCHVVIWDQPWLKNRVVTNSSCETGTSRSKRSSANPPGAPRVTSVDDPYVREVAKFSLAKLDGISNAVYARKIVNIHTATEQVVEGHLYKLQIELGETTCRNGENENIENCALKEGTATEICHVQIWDRPWLENDEKRKLTNFSCEASTARTKRSTSHPLVGAPQETSVDDAYVREIAKFSLVQMESTSNAINAQKIVRIHSATNQVVEGSLYKLKIEIGETTCRKGQNANVDNCALKAGSTTRICNVEIWDRPWLQNAEKRKLNKYSCEASGARPKRSTTSPSVGAPQETSVNDAYVREIAKFSLVQMESTSNAINAQKIVRIHSATKQVVSGSLYKLKIEVGETTCRKGQNANVDNCALKAGSATRICNVEIWDRPWLQNAEKRKLTKFSCVANAARPKRSTTRPLAGAPRETSVDDPYVREIASFSLVQMESTSNAINAQKIVKIHTATKQVVAGSLYKLKIEIGETTCRKGENENVDNCALQEGSATQICNVEIWDRPWLQADENRKLTNSSCETSTTRAKRSNTRPLDGGIQEVSVDNTNVQEVAKVALAHIDGMSNALYAQKLVKVLHATRQVVGGMKYKLTLELGYSNCRKGGNVDSDTCLLKDDSNNQICHVEIWSRPWENSTRVLNVSCSPSPNLVKRSLIGGGTHDIHVGLFQKFVAQHGKEYPNEMEYKRRFRIFRANMKKVEMLKQTERGTGKYGATVFADLTSKEFKKLYLGLRPTLKTTDQVALPMANIPDITLPPEYDWRNYNVVTPVKNQGMCGSCWAFSVTGNIEGQWALRRGELLSLSEQELVDCDKLDDGCKGGLPENAYKAIAELGGLETESDYPYEGDDEKCHLNKTEVKVTVTGGLNITKNETQMAQWLVKNGPISIGINANAMQFYTGGVSHPWKMLCNADDLDHGVLIVGYGVHNYPIFKKSLPYWIVKNSWGESWGEQGYYRVYRGDGTCGVNQMATSAVVG